MYLSKYQKSQQHYFDKLKFIIQAYQMSQYALRKKKQMKRRWYPHDIHRREFAKIGPSCFKYRVSQWLKYEKSIISIILSFYSLLSRSELKIEEGHISLDRCLTHVGYMSALCLPNISRWRMYISTFIVRCLANIVRTYIRTCVRYMSRDICPPYILLRFSALIFCMQAAICH